MTETIVTKENMHRLAAEFQFEVEEELGHLLPAGTVYAKYHYGAPEVAVNVDKCSEAALEIIMRRCGVDQ